MYTLLIILMTVGNSGRSVSSTTIEFSSKALCEEAKSQVQTEVSYYDQKTVTCLKTKY